MVTARCDLTKQMADGSFTARCSLLTAYCILLHGGMMKKQVALFSTFLGWILASGLLATPPVQAQQWSPPVPTNLKVLPPDTAPRAVIGTMRGFAQGLGVRCQHCHGYCPYLS